MAHCLVFTIGPIQHRSAKPLHLLRGYSLNFPLCRLQLDMTVQDSVLYGRKVGALSAASMLEWRVRKHACECGDIQRTAQVFDTE